MTDNTEPDATTQRYVRQGYPSIEELMRAQGVKPVNDVRELLGDFWPEDESIDDFIAAVREWRGHTKNDRAA